MVAENRAFGYAAIALKILEKILGSRFFVEGIKDLPNQPILFVSNHFTRFETFVVPYIIYKHTGRQVRCLADSGLYHGMLGKFLTSVGTISTKDLQRDNIILKDLIAAKYDWMIYPEGGMIKSKEIKKEAEFINYTPNRVGPVRTGSSVMALKSQLYRQDMIEAFTKGDMNILNKLEAEVGLSYQTSFKDIDTYIVPLNISYYPIRPGNNNIKKLAAHLIKKIPTQIAEELEIEGNLLLNSDINLHFGKAINLANYTKPVQRLINKVPLLKENTKNNLILKYFKYRLTNEFMSKIYCDLQINFDHIFSAVLYLVNENEITIDRLKRIIYLSAIMIDQRKYRLNHSIFEENLFKIFIDEPHQEFDSVFALAKEQNLISESSPGKIIINKNNLNKKYDFHEIRLENTLSVIANEFFLLDDLKKIVARNCKIDESELRQKVFNEIYEKDLEIFAKDYHNFFDKNFSKNKTVGSPFFIDSKTKKQSDKSTAILLCHGYKSAPQEVFQLAKFINELGFKTYAVRLKGHGTAPINIKEVSWQDWYNSLQRGYAALRNIAKEVIMIGFSTGGLLTLLSAAHKKNIPAIVSISSALKLVDVRARFVPGINIYNELLEKLHINKSKIEFVDDKPENPDFNYNRNYLKGVEELGKLMDECNQNLNKITAPALIIQAKQDPIVNPKSAAIIFEKIQSKNKIIFEPNFSNHCIINGENREEVFMAIKDFLLKIIN
ncbi:MAG: alpha/beta fold hydrolase [Rickettsiales bacterium]|nr:alpha/beta fold hydrolase [Rickettsiales bacterium]